MEISGKATLREIGSLGVWRDYTFVMESAAITVRAHMITDDPQAFDLHEGESYEVTFSDVEDDPKSCAGEYGYLIGSVTSIHAMRQ